MTEQAFQSEQARKACRAERADSMGMNAYGTAIGRARAGTQERTQRVCDA